VKPNLIGCTSYLTGLQAAVTAGARLILPTRCNITEASWSGLGYFDIRVSAGGGNIGSIISGGLNGGYFTSPAPESVVVPRTAGNTKITDSTGKTNVAVGATLGGDPIDMFKGNYVYSRDDITVGQGAFPYALGFQKLYTSGARLERGELGNGWTHNFKASARVGVDGYQGVGEDSPIDAATSIVEQLVSLDLLTDAAKPLNKVVIANLGQRWFADQLLDNTVVVTQGQSSEVFVKLPDGSYNPPPASNAKLIKNTDGTYKYETLDKVALNFNTAGNIGSWVLTLPTFGGHP
jgi:hypothetical protein